MMKTYGNVWIIESSHHRKTCGSCHQYVQESQFCRKSTNVRTHPVFSVFMGRGIKLTSEIALTL